MHRKLKDTPLGTPEQFNVVVEIPRGSVDKIEYDENKDEMHVDFVFKDGFTFQYNYGFIPHTRTDDGDTLDAILLGTKPMASGTVVLCRPIGVMRQIDRGQVDDKIIAVPVGDKETQKYQSVEDISQEEIKQFILFYAEVARQKQKTIEITGFEDKDKAIEAIRKAMI
ncbi:MAG: inorganic diphosphatase [Candidatus Doudnabacteria bacterium]|nr:inorganic diphosphatase [Candidatus Doudnabacteria bacterium]